MQHLDLGALNEAKLQQTLFEFGSAQAVCAFGDVDGLDMAAEAPDAPDRAACADPLSKMEAFPT